MVPKLPWGEIRGYRELKSCPEPNQGVVNGIIAVRVVAAHDVADYGRALAEAGPRAHPGLEHRVDDPSLHRLQSVPNVGEGPRNDDRHRIVEERLLDLVVDIDHDVVLFIGAFVDHVSFSLSDVEEPDVLGVALDELLARSDIVAHQRGEDLLRQRRIFQFDLDQVPQSRIHRGVSKFGSIHLAQSFEPADVELPAVEFLPELVQFVIGGEVVDVLAGFDPIQRGLGEIHIPGLDERPHVTEEEREQAACGYAHHRRRRR